MKIKFPFFLLFLFVSISAMSQQKHKKPSASFKIIGYYFLNAALRDTVHSDSSYLFLNKITHLNIAFINPDTTGNFNLELAIDTLIKKAHDKNVKVIVYIGSNE